MSYHVDPKSSRGAARVLLTRKLLSNLPLHHRVDLTNSDSDENFKGKIGLFLCLVAHDKEVKEDL